MHACLYFIPPSGHGCVRLRVAPAQARPSLGGNPALSVFFHHVRRVAGGCPVVVSHSHRLPRPQPAYSHVDAPPRLRPLDLEVMAALHQQVNLIPVIAKADSMTVEERRAFKQRVREDLEQGGIRCYPPFSTEIEDEEEASFNDTLRVRPCSPSPALLCDRGSRC